MTPPKATRVGFYKGVLNQFIVTLGRIPRPEPLDCHELHEKFCTLIRDESDPWDYSQESSWNGITYHLKDVSWQEFFDFVELVVSSRRLTSLDFCTWNHLATCGKLIGKSHISF